MAPFHCKDTSPTLARSGTLAARALINVVGKTLQKYVQIVVFATTVFVRLLPGEYELLLIIP